MASNSSRDTVEQVGREPAHVETQALGVAPRELSAPSLRSLPVTSQIGALVLERERDGAAAGADVEHARRPGAAPARPRPAAPSPDAGSARGDRPRAPSGGNGGGQGCRRPARAAPSGVARSPGRARTRPAADDVRSLSMKSRSRETPSACASSSSASSRGVSQPAAAIAVTAPSSASRTGVPPASDPACGRHFWRLCVVLGGVRRPFAPPGDGASRRPAERR